MPSVLRKPKKRPTPSNWASWRPFGLGETRPNNYREVFRAAWENRDNARYAWRILSAGCCDGCALGTKGLRDWTLSGTHVCNVRLRLLRLNTMGPLDPAPLADARELEGRTAAQLRQLGRLAQPMLRRAGEPGFTAVSWDEALALAAERIGAADPERVGFYLTSRRDVERELLRGPEGGPRDRHQLDRQRGPRLPLAQHVRDQGGARRRRHDLLVRGLDRHRPGRLHRLQRRQQPAGGDEVPAPGQEGRHQGGRRSTPTASPGWSATGSPRHRRARCSAPGSPTASSRSRSVGTSASSRGPSST